MITATVVAGISMVASAGYVIWAIRGVSLMSSFLSSVPIWIFLDPMPILGRPDTEEEKDERDGDKDEEKIARLFD